MDRKLWTVYYVENMIKTNDIRLLLLFFFKIYDIVFFDMILTQVEFKRLKKRDPEIFKKVYLEYKDNIYNFLMIKTCGDLDAAEDLISEIFQSALLSIPKLRSSKKIFSWLMQIARRRYCDFLRKKYRDQKYNEIIREQKKLDTVDKDLSDEIIKKEKVLLVKMAMENMNEEYKEMLELKYIHGKSLKEIEQKMNKKFLAVQSMLFRARKALKKEIERLSGIMD